MYYSASKNHAVNNTSKNQKGGKIYLRSGNIACRIRRPEVRTTYFTFEGKIVLSM
jgi:hypothetical protein